jgi:hypothetical protein
LTFLLFDGKVMKGSPVSKPVEVVVKSPKVLETIEKPAPLPSPTPAPEKQTPAQEATVASDTSDSGSKFNDGRLLCTHVSRVSRNSNFFLSLMFVFVNSH